MFPLPFEYEAIQHDWADLRTWLEGQNILEWQVRPHRPLLSPKARHGFRVITQLDPLDFLIFAATIREIASDIEANRIPINQNVVFSYRFAAGADGQLFDFNIGYEAFLNQTRFLLQDNAINFVAITDIADFYPRIYHHDSFFKLLVSARDTLTKRQLILAMGRASQRHWFQSQWRSLFDEPHWSRRALLAAASCMPTDARKHWYRSVEARLDSLERAVMRWARQYPFGG